MSLFTAEDRALAAVISELTYCNPFLPQRVALEREALGSDFTPTRAVWSLENVVENANITALLARLEPLIDDARAALVEGASASGEELRQYEDGVRFMLYHRHWREMHRQIVEPTSSEPSALTTFWSQFQADHRHYLQLPGHRFPENHEPAHLFACFFQIRRAFVHIFNHIIGRSLAAAQLRAAVWQSIFTHDLRRYIHSRYRHMGDITTLVTGPSGTGKELVARAIGLSRYIPFSAKSVRFAADFSELFMPLNLSALSPTLIESELFGHARGSFTGAVADRTGWLEVCPELGTVFLDEIGELDVSIQVKLLRVLQSRRFQRLGETQSRSFHGKIVAATNRDLHEELASRRFREDFYYRLCADMVTTPSLRQLLAESPEDLHLLILFIARRFAEDEAETLAFEVEQWIATELGRDYAWPGNIRELEQCVRNIWVRKEYRPLPTRHTQGLQAMVASAVSGGELTAEEMMRYYCTLVYANTPSYEACARRLNLDWRTVKAKIDHDLLARSGHPTT